MSPYQSPSNLPPHQTPQGSPRQNSSPDSLRQPDSVPHGEVKGSMTGTEGGDRETERQQWHSEGSMHNSPTSGSIVKEKPYTTPTTAEQRHYPSKNMLTGLEDTAAPPHPQSQPPRLPTPPQPITLITISRALYLLVTGKLAWIPDVLYHAPLIDLFNHFLDELVVDQDWARTLAGIDYNHYGYSYILKEEARHFACYAYNMIHPDQPIEVPTHYQRPKIDLPPIVYTPEPLQDEPPVPPRWAEIPVYARMELSYAYLQGYGLPGMQEPSWLFTAATGNEPGTSDQAQNKPQPPGLPQLPAPPIIPRRWVAPHHPSPPKPPDPPDPWLLTRDEPGPWGALKLNMVKEPRDFSSDSNDIAWFFSQCNMYFSVFNQYFQYHPHKVIFCTSCFTKDTQVWWELYARELGRNALRDQQYPAYEQFVEEVRWRFWKDANAEIKFAQWEKLQQSNFPDDDLFFQQFESLAFEAGILGIDQMMMAQVKKACRSSSKDIIYTSDGEVLTNYQEWKQCILCIDHNWRTQKAEMGGGPKVTDWKQQSKTNTQTKGTSQQQTSVPEKKMGTGTVYGGQGMPMDIDRTKMKAKCFWCGETGHFKRDCPKGPKTREEALQWLNYY